MATKGFMDFTPGPELQNFVSCNFNFSAIS